MSQKRPSKKRFSAVPPKSATITGAKKSASDAVRDAAEAAAPVSKSVPPTAATAPVIAEIAPVAEAHQATIHSTDCGHGHGVEASHEHPTIAAVSPVAQNVCHKQVDENVAGLVYALRDPDADIARDAAVSLGQTGSEAAIQPLIAALSNIDGYTHPVVRAAAAASLGQLGNKSAVASLITALHDPMAEASAEAVRALAAIGCESAVPSLIEIVRNADGFFLATVRRAAVAALAKLGGPAAEAELKAVAANEFEDALLREEATAAVKQ